MRPVRVSSSVPGPSTQSGGLFCVGRAVRRSGSGPIVRLGADSGTLIVDGAAALSASATLWAPVASIRDYASRSNGNPAPSGSTPASVVRADFTTPPVAGDLLVAVISVDDRYYPFDVGSPSLTGLTSGITWTLRNHGGQTLDNSIQTYIYTARATGTSADDMSIAGAGDGSEHSVILSIVAVANAGTASYSDGGTSIGSVNNLLIGGTADGALGNASYPYRYLSPATASTSGFSLGQTLGYGLQSTATTAGSVDGAYISITYGYTVSGAASLAGDGTLTAAGIRISDAAAALTSSATLTAAGIQVAVAASSLSGSALLSASATVSTPGGAVTGDAALTASMALTVTGVSITDGSVSASSSSTLAATGTTLAQGVASLTSSGSLTASSTLIAVSAATLSATATAQATALLLTFASLSMSTTLTLTGDGTSAAPTTRGHMTSTSITVAQMVVASRLSVSAPAIITKSPRDTATIMPAPKPEPTISKTARPTPSMIGA